MNMLSTFVICMASLATATLELSLDRVMSFAAPKAVAATFIAEYKVSEKATVYHQEFHSLLCAYKPPSGIGGPKRTGGSGGRYI